MAKIRSLITGIISTLVFSTVLFIAAGTAAYLQGYVFLGANLLSNIIHFLALPADDQLLNERAAIRKDAKAWDKVLLGISALIYLVTIITAGLDAGRFHRPSAINWPLCSTGIALTLGGQIIFLSALRQNKFFSSVVRIQKERGHTVCDTGLYRLMRHPGYLGMTVSLLGVPFITGSVWSAVPTAIAVILLVIRTELEDNTLKNELEGYRAYTLKTKHKLIPFIW